MIKNYYISYLEHHATDELHLSIISFFALKQGDAFMCRQGGKSKSIFCFCLKSPYKIFLILVLGTKPENLLDIYLYFIIGLCLVATWNKFMLIR